MQCHDNYYTTGVKKEEKIKGKIHIIIPLTAEQTTRQCDSIFSVHKSTFRPQKKKKNNTKLITV